MEEKWKKLEENDGNLRLPFWQPTVIFLVTHGHLFNNRWLLFLKMLINCEQSQKSKNFHKKVDEKNGQKRVIFCKKFFIKKWQNLYKSFFRVFLKTLILCGLNRIHGYLFNNSRLSFLQPVPFLQRLLFW